MLRLAQLAQELDWQVRELCQADPRAGEIEAGYHEKQVIATADKIQRELLSTVRFDPQRLVGVGGPIEPIIDSVAELLVAIEKIRQEAAGDLATLPSSVRVFRGLLTGYCEDGAPKAA